MIIQKWIVTYCKENLPIWTIQWREVKLASVISRCINVKSEGSPKSIPLRWEGQVVEQTISWMLCWMEFLGVFSLSSFSRWATLWSGWVSSWGYWGLNEHWQRQGSWRQTARLELLMIYSAPWDSSTDWQFLQNRRRRGSEFQTVAAVPWS